MPRSNDRPCATRLCMYLSKAEGQRGCNFELLVSQNECVVPRELQACLVKKTTHVFARGGGNFELL